MGQLPSKLTAGGARLALWSSGVVVLGAACFGCGAPPTGTDAGSHDASAIDASPPPDATSTVDAGPADADAADACVPAGDPLPVASRLAYLADQREVGTYELYFRDVTAGELSSEIRISGDLTAGGSVLQRVCWSPDRRKIAYLADQEQDEMFELYVVDVSGSPPGAAQKVSPPLPIGGTAYPDFAWSPTGRELAFVADEEFAGKATLYVADVTGDVPEPPVKLASPSLTSAVWLQGWSPDARWILYTDLRLFAVDVGCDADPEPVRVTNLGSEVPWEVYPHWSPDSAWLALGGARTSVDSDLELYLVDMRADLPADARRISGAMPEGGELKDMYWAPDSSRILYRADQRTDEQHELFFVQVNGWTLGRIRRINGELPPRYPAPGGGGQTRFPMWSPDSTKVTYLADQEVDGKGELWVVDVSGVVPGASIRVNSPLPDGGDVGVPEWSPNGTHLLYVADQEVDNVRNLYVVDMSGDVPGVPLRVNPPLVANGRVDGGFSWAPDQTRFVYRTDQEVFGTKHLYVVPFADGSPGEAVRISDPLPSFGEIQDDFRWSPDSSHLAYRADLVTDDQLDLYVVDASGTVPGAPIKVNSTMASGGSVQYYWWAP